MSDCDNCGRSIMTVGVEMDDEFWCKKCYNQTHDRERVDTGANSWNDTGEAKAHRVESQRNTVINNTRL